MLGAAEFAKRTPWPYLVPAPDSPEFKAVIEKLLWTPGFSVLLAEDGDRLVGVIGFWIGEYIMNVGKLEWQEIFWWGALDAPAWTAMRLLRAAYAFGVAVKCAVFTAHVMHNSPPAARLMLRRLGLREMQSTFSGVA